VRVVLRTTGGAEGWRRWLAEGRYRSGAERARACGVSRETVSAALRRREQAEPQAPAEPRAEAGPGAARRQVAVAETSPVRYTSVAH